MLNKYMLLVSMICIVLPLSTNAKIYGGSWYTMNLWSNNWNYSSAENSSGYDSYSLDGRTIQLSSPNRDVYSVITSWDKNSIASLFNVYKETIGSTDMMKEQSRITKNGPIHFASFTADTESKSKFYGFFCIVTDTKMKNSIMVNIIDITKPVKKIEGMKICSSIKSKSF